MNHEIDKLPRKNNSQITLHIICINFQVVFFENFENLQLLTQFVKKQSSYIFLLNQGRSIF